ncbi:hypothetical protein P5673_027418, partial [Acropora cervicornis]
MVCHVDSGLFLALLMTRNQTDLPLINFMEAISVAQVRRVTELAFMGFLFLLLRNVMSAISVAQSRRVAELAFMGFLFFLLRNVMSAISVAQIPDILDLQHSRFPVLMRVNTGILGPTEFKMIISFEVLRFGEDNLQFSCTSGRRRISLKNIMTMIKFMINLFLYPKQVYKTVYLIIAFEVLTFGTITFLNLAFHMREKVDLEMGHKPVDLTSSAYV